MLSPFSFRYPLQNDFLVLVPYLQVVVDKAGLLKILWLLPLLPIGAIMQAYGLMKEHIIEKWQAVFIIIGLLLLNNPEIELISTIGSVLMCIGYINWSYTKI